MLLSPGCPSQEGTGHPAECRQHTRWPPGDLGWPAASRQPPGAQRVFLRSLSSPSRWPSGGRGPGEQAPCAPRGNKACAKRLPWSASARTGPCWAGCRCFDEASSAGVSGCVRRLLGPPHGVASEPAPISSSICLTYFILTSRILKTKGRKRWCLLMRFASAVV